MHILPTNLAKTLVCKRGYDLILRLHKQRKSSNNDCYMTLLNRLLEYGKSHTMKQSPWASPDICTPLAPVFWYGQHTAELTGNFILSWILSLQQK